MTQPVRTEHDLLGDRAVPADAYYGVHTLRALENFPITGTAISIHPDLVSALACVKQAAALANNELGLLDDERTQAIVQACREIRDGALLEEFVVDVIQGGAGTSTNMNANEVIANRALELMGHRKGDYAHCDPHEHVNCSQSTNDAYPSALHVGMALGNRELLAAVQELIAAFRAKGKEFAGVLKMGRTQLQDAVPMTLGQEFAAWARSLADEAAALRAVERVLCEINMGGTAIGTGLNAPPGYAEKCAAHLARIARKPIHLATDLGDRRADRVRDRGVVGADDR